ncbi:MAG: hypothetical protein PHU25_02785 [Deltaproteobacteria bacterium]|nr:hypothetical protein [Deltaproteobacteria bacterium]
MMGAKTGELGPLEIVDRLFRRTLHGGGLGIVMARAGVGKTAFLAQVGLVDLLRGRDVLHVALGQTVDQIKARYDGMLDELAKHADARDFTAERAAIGKHRVIKTYGDGRLSLDRVERTMATFGSHMGFAPAAILMDGFDWSGPIEDRTADIEGLKALSGKLGASLWATAKTHLADAREASGGLPQPCAPYADLVDLAVFIEPLGDRLEVRLLKRPGVVGDDDMAVFLCTESLLPLPVSEVCGPARPPSGAFTLLSGGAEGAEAEFGLAAERSQVAEVNYTFVGRAVARSRGLVVLDDEELRQGDVSFTYLSAHMHRNYPRTADFRKIMQSIWHQVSSAGEVFAVGVIQPDKTFKGGTGWAAELARRWRKPLQVFDQERRGWFAWRGSDWVAVPPPVVTHLRFCGTGTRSLTPEGRAAIRDLFARSFGPGSEGP